MSRLIDADALMKNAVVKFYITPYFNHISKMIEDASAIDAKPVQHGNWSDPQLIYTDAHQVTCSVCGERVVIAKHKNFCPNCGTDWRGNKDG